MLHEIPMAGDVVRLDGFYPGAKRGSFAVLEGRLGVVRDEYLACFGASAYRDSRHVSCSGGPAPYIALDDLVPTGETKLQRFWHFRNGVAMAHNGQDFHVEVPVWSWVPDQARSRLDKALSSYRFWKDNNAPDWSPDIQGASRVLGIPVIERPLPDIASLIDAAVPEQLRSFTIWFCETCRIGGLADPMYICNVIAAESGQGDGRGVFYKSSGHRENAASTIAARLFGSYSFVRRSVTSEQLIDRLSLCLV